VTLSSEKQRVIISTKRKTNTGIKLQQLGSDRRRVLGASGRDARARERSPHRGRDRVERVRGREDGFRADPAGPVRSRGDACDVVLDDASDRVLALTQIGDVMAPAFALHFDLAAPFLLLRGFGGPETKSVKFPKKRKKIENLERERPSLSEPEEGERGLRRIHPDSSVNLWLRDGSVRTRF
jgi:hypothetical protein